MGSETGKQGLAVAKEHCSCASRGRTPCFDEGLVGLGPRTDRLFKQCVSLIHGPTVVVSYLGIGLLELRAKTIEQVPTPGRRPLYERKLIGEEKHARQVAHLPLHRTALPVYLI